MSGPLYTTFCGLQQLHSPSLVMHGLDRFIYLNESHVTMSRNTIANVGLKTKSFPILNSSSYLLTLKFDCCLLSIPSNNVFCAVVLFQLNLLIHARPSIVLLHTVLAVGL